MIFKIFFRKIEKLENIIDFKCTYIFIIWITVYADLNI